MAEQRSFSTWPNPYPSLVRSEITDMVVVVLVEVWDGKESQEDKGRERMEGVYNVYLW